MACRCKKRVTPTTTTVASPPVQVQKAAAVAGVETSARARRFTSFTLMLDGGGPVQTFSSRLEAEAALRRSGRSGTIRF